MTWEDYRLKDLSRRIRCFEVQGSSLEPDYHNREIIIVDRDLAPSNGNHVVYWQNGELKVGKFKKIGENGYIESRGQNIRYKNVRTYAVIINSYLVRPAKHFCMTVLAGLVWFSSCLASAIQVLA